MEARNRLLPEWFTRIKTRQISLPRFQRMVAWGANEVAGLLTTVLRGLPGGATLILEVGDDLPFISRTMLGAPKEGERITELLLDGQQRLTALWRSLSDDYEDRTFFVEFEDDPDDPNNKLPNVFGQSRWMRNGKRYPVWADDPAEIWKRGYIPVSLLSPGDIEEETDTWLSIVAGEDWNLEKLIHKKISELRDQVKTFNLPFLSLPVSTPRSVALDVFIKMNTSSVALTTFDILVAQVESVAGESLHDLVTRVTGEIPATSEYKRNEDLILDVAALMQNRSPNQVGYNSVNLEEMIERWDELIANIKFMVDFLEAEAVFDGRRLPTDSVIAVLAALHSHLPTNPDELGNAKGILRRYLWRSFFTGRYDRAAATAALQDFRALRSHFEDGSDVESVPCFDEKTYPLATSEQLVLAGWPKNRNTLARGILGLTLKAGARDIADDSKVTREHLKLREYHHLFPASTLREAGLSDSEIFRSLNCALITWRTNRKISNKDPIDYLKERAESNNLGEEDLDRRLLSHLIPEAEIKVGGYGELSGDQRSEKVRADYKNFLTARAELIEPLMQKVCSGQELS